MEYAHSGTDLPHTEKHELIVNWFVRFCLEVT